VIAVSQDLSASSEKIKDPGAGVVCVATGCGLDVLNPDRGKVFFSFSNLSDRLSGPPNLLCFSRG